MGVSWGEATGARVRNSRPSPPPHHDRRERGRRRLARRGGHDEHRQGAGGAVPGVSVSPAGASVRGQDHDALVFGDGIVHQAHPDDRRGWFIPAVRSAQLVDKTFQRVTIHDMRHTAASLAASAVANVKVLQNMLGHASAAMTLDIYSDVFDEVLEAIGVALDEARRRALVGQPTGAGKTKPPASQRLQGIQGV